MTDHRLEELERRIADLVDAMASEADDFVAEVTALGAAWCRARVERFVCANYSHTLAMDLERLSQLRAATDALVAKMPERMADLVAKRNDIWMHRRLTPNSHALFSYEGGQQLPERLRGAIAAALVASDGLLVDYGYMQRGAPSGAGLDPSPRMRATLRRYSTMQTELHELVGLLDGLRRAESHANELSRLDAGREAGVAAACRRWEEAAKAPPKPGGVSGEPTSPDIGT